VNEAEMAEPADIAAEAEQPLLGYLSNDDWQALLADLNERVERMEALPQGDIRQQVFALLNSIDAVHREALHRLVRLFKEGVLEKVVTDPAIHTLMELYDLLPEQATAPPPPAFATIPIRPVAASPSAAVQRIAHWVPAPLSSEASTGAELFDDLVIDGLPLLLARRDQRWYALAAACPVDGAPLHGANLGGFTLSCPNHGGCHYDVRNGQRLGGGAPLRCFPVKADPQGRVLVGLGMDFTPEMPSF
jgi:nitrite reductase/ring-hydroxylating ferredoxin subunit